MSELKYMEHSTLKVPYEIIKKKYRTAQRSLDREMDQVLNASKKTNATIKNVRKPPTIAEISKLLGNVVCRLQVLKKKAEKTINDELNASLICKSKLSHLRGIVPSEKENGNFDVLKAKEQWKRIRMDRMVVEHLLRMGYYETAERLAVRSDIRNLTNLDIFHTFREVEEDLAKHKTTKCILWFMDNKAKLGKTNSNIEFNLRAQEFVELVRNNYRLDAVKHARKYFPSFEKTHLSEICKCMALLAYQPNTTLAPYRTLFDEQRWEQLAQSFRNENYRLFKLSQRSLLSVVVQAGLTSLKTPQCYSVNFKNFNCPVCDKDFNSLAMKFPYSHRDQSRLVCRVTGQALNENNLPMMLPNGQVFGQMAIPEITKDNGLVVCPITKTSFINPKIEKVFVL